MAKPRATTIQQRFGFQDGDLKTPKHDEMMLWLDSNLLKIVGAMAGSWDNGRDAARKEGCPEELLSEEHNRTLDRRTWEYPIVDRKYGGAKYVIGFVDLWASCTAPELRRWESGEWHWGNPTKYFYFEVKSTIPSLGELIRQIRMYQEYIETHLSGAFYIVSPDARFKDALRSQGIGFVHYPSGEV